MTLQRKTLTYVCVVLVLQLAVLAGVAKLVHDHYFGRLEREFSVRSADSVRVSVNDDLRRMGVLASDYYCWNQMYDFFAQPDHSFPDENLTAESLRSLGVDVMAGINVSGDVVLSRAVTEKGDLTAVPDSVVNLLRRLEADHSPGGEFPEHLSYETLPEGVLIFAARDVLRNDRSGPSRGVGLMGRWLTRGILEGYEKTGGVSILMNAPVTDAGPSMDGNQPVHLRNPSTDVGKVSFGEGKSRVTLTFSDHYGAPQFQLVLTRDMLVSRLGAQATGIILLTVILLALVSCLGTVYLLNRIVLRRVAQMAEDVRAIASKANFQKRLNVDSQDEIGGLASDINALLTQLGHTEEALRDRSEQLRMLLEKSPLAISITDTEDRIIFTNERYRDLAGIGSAPFTTLGQLQEFVMPDPDYRKAKVAEMEASLREARETGLPAKPVEYRARTHSGRELDIEVFIAEVGGRMFRIVNDVTEKKRMVRELQGALKARELFMANVSHEIRTPLNGVVGMVQILRETPMSADQRECLDTINESCDLLVAIINDILDISRIEAGTLRLCPEPVHLQVFVAGVVGLVSQGMTLKGLDFLCEVPDDLPGDFLFDPVRLRQVLLNLLSNAVKFTERGSVTLRASYESQGEGRGMLFFAVSDTGPGISIEDRCRLFRPFEQVDSSHSRRHGGTGLGLAISDRLVKLMGGKIHLESTPGLGSTFSFSIPVFVAPAGSVTLSHGAAESLPPFSEKRCTMSLLVAEDNPVNQKVIGMMLRRLGATPDFAANGARALEMALAKDYDVILMDVQMPVMDGLEATREILKRLPEDRRTDIVALTAHARVEDVKACLDAGMVAHLSKPLKTQDLFRVLLDICKRRHPETATASSDA
jgi:PAS domain S-box-containing protein